VRLHLGTTDVGARIVAPGGPVAPGELRAARAILEEPVAARSGDRFVLRASSPPVTIGGGIVRDPAPPHRRVRPWPPSLVDPVERLRAMLAEGGLTGVETRGLAQRVGVIPGALGGLQALAEAVVIGTRLYPSGTLEQAGARLVQSVGEYQTQHPLEPGTPQSWLRTRLALNELAFDEIVRRALSSGVVVLRDGLLMPPGWAPRLDERHQATRDAVLRQLSASGREPPSTADLVAAHGQQVISLLRILEREGLVVSVEPQGARYYATQALTGLVRELRNAMAGGGVTSPAELREVLHMSRKFLIPFLEYCDREGITERREAGRVLATRGARHGT
jgi:selenocysteine-specific elongation factor